MDRSPPAPQSGIDELRKAGLTAKLSKCQFGMNECRFLGDMVGDGQIHPDDDKGCSSASI